MKKEVTPTNKVSFFFDNMQNAFTVLSLMILCFFLGCVTAYAYLTYKCCAIRSNSARRSNTSERQQPFLNQGLSYLEERRNREINPVIATRSAPSSQNESGIDPSIFPNAPTVPMNGERVESVVTQNFSQL